MQEASEAKESIAVERKGQDKGKKKQKEEKPKAKKTRRHFREEAKQAQAETTEVKRDTERTELNEMNRSDSATSSLSPSAIVEMFHLQDDEYLPSFPSSASAATARYLVENETTGDFYQVKTRQRRQNSSLLEHGRHRRTSLTKAQQKARDGSAKAETWMCWAILLRDGEKAAVVMILGIVAGMCWMDALNLRAESTSSSTSGSDRFLCVYSAGLIRELSQMKPHQEYKALGDGAIAELTSYKLLQAATALLTTALVVLLISSPSALYLTRAQQTNKTWHGQANDTS
ncbi:hypothetical protein PF003_g16760 [Phytophthora fragariae]|nr:hypothetical protein PF003_g16760 [Phytophthora fragariae]